VSAEEAERVIQLLKDGMRMPEVAAQTGIAYARVHWIKKMSGIAAVPARASDHQGRSCGPPAVRTPIPATIRATCDQVAAYAAAVNLPWRRTAADLKAINLVRHENGLGPFLVPWRELVA
jgi:hypothetical protein